MEKVINAPEASLMPFPSLYTIESTTILTFITVSYCKWSHIVHTLFCGCFHSTFCSCISSTLQHVVLVHVFSLHYNILLYLLLFSAKSSCPTLCDLMNFSAPGLPVLTISQSLLKLMSIELVMPSSHLIFCCSFLLLPSIFPSIGVFSSESALHIKWPKFWNFSFSINPSNEYSGLISFRID